MHPEPFNHTEEATLIARITDEDIVELTLGGEVTTESRNALIAWTEKVRDLLRHMKEQNPNRVLTLVDVSDLHKYDTDAIEICRDLMANNHGLATKTAIYGASTLVRATIELMIGITRRYSMKIFAEREEARAWLLDDSQRPEISE